MNTYEKLYEEAVAARERSYSPYSGITVGAALLTKDGGLYTGANIENASYTPTVCAERVAIFTAIHDGARDFDAIAIAGGKAGQLSDADFVPCGVCRQVMTEFTDSDFKIITGDKDGKIIVRTLSEMLPFGFDFSKL